MKLINAKKHFTNKDILSFVDGLEDTDMIDVLLEKSNSALSIQVSNLRNFFTDESIEQYITDDDDTISFICKDNCLQIAGQDYKWYIATVRNVKYARLDKLFDTTTEKVKKEKVKKETDNSKLLRVAICTLCEFHIDNVSIFEGTKQQCVAFINKEYSIREIRNRFDNSTRISFDYKGQDTEWKTLELLEQEGVITL